ncbi:hypothetical protein XA68_17423 [Ophiocordyceps unilateralis]|uniref:ADF-H domain-containing protein n=1 Tax=Ophiocordyceps unilateralis TaxID=268505 RepID=A0A2A9P4Y0_OPHUN|nr:hypothetical protein XA68_17423 [Ophiocordyceps unilateralis]
MSLNGLDGTAILEAHETATAEPGGWFLLKYSNRDEVELLSRGNGGIVEMRNAVADYEETSPLYGFLKYRRRNVVVKYLPADCSRLIQARVAVHFNAICERFHPYDTAFEIEAATDLKDAKLSAACSLHAASCSTSSSTSSLRRRRLMEIAEEEEGEQRAYKRQSTHEASGGRPRSSGQDRDVADPVALDSKLAAFPQYSEFTANSTSEVPTFVGLNPRPNSSAKSSDAENRLDASSYPSLTGGKAKVRLGPRPSLDVSGRPRTAGNFRPISAVPPGFKLFGKGNKNVSSDKAHSSLAVDATPNEEIASLDHGSTTAIAAEESYQTKTDAVRPVTSSGASAVHVTRPFPQTAKRPAISSEKARLMKAMQLRQKKKMMAFGASTTTAVTHDHGPEGEDVDTVAKKANMESSEMDTAKADTEAITQMDPALHADQRSDLTESDSRPVSPVVALSEAEQSTKASSLSESTDDTARGKLEEHALDDGVAVQGSSLADVELDVPTQGSVHETIRAAVEREKQVCVLVADEEKTTRAPGDEPMDQVAAESDAIAATSATIIAVLTPEVVSDPRTKSAGDCGTPRITSLPISKFSIDAPLSPKPARETASSGDDSETLAFQAVAHGQSETSDVDGSLASPQWKSPDSHVSTLYSPDSKVASPLLQRAFKAGQTEASENTSAIIESLKLDGETDTVSIGQVQTRRKAHVEPIRTDLAQHSRHTSHSGIDFSDDEELMEELQSATLQEAKPMVVAKTPVSATFSTGPKGRPSLNAQPTHMIRTISNPVRGNLIAPTDVSQSSARSVSTGAAYLHQVTQQQQQQGANLAKKPNIGSGISQRIKALEKLSASSGDAGTTSSRERPSSTFYAVKKREPSRPPSAIDGSNSMRKSVSDSQDSSSEPATPNRRQRFESTADCLSVLESLEPRRGRQESVSVTARIIRDGTSAAHDASEYGRLELKQSPLVVDHYKAMPEPTSPVEDLPSGRRRSTSEERAKPGKPRQSSLSVVKDFIKERRKSVASSQGDGASTSASQPRSPSLSPPMFQGSGFSPRLSISSRRSSFNRDHESTASPTGESVGDEGKWANGDKKLSRAGRFKRCLSTLSGSRSKNSLSGISDAVAEEAGADDTRLRMTTSGSSTTVSYMGDVNVQFPDTLLWKRKNLSLDSQGFLILSALPAQSGRQAQGTKRYHLSEFRPPYVPDVEVQELPNSVVLDFIEGATIQVACEDRAGQFNVLSILREAHAMQQELPCGL